MTFGKCEKTPGFFNLNCKISTFIDLVYLLPKSPKLSKSISMGIFGVFSRGFHQVVSILI
jgi:hypothetical protein